MKKLMCPGQAVTPKDFVNRLQRKHWPYGGTMTRLCDLTKKDEGALLSIFGQGLIETMYNLEMHPDLDPFWKVQSVSGRDPDGQPYDDLNQDPFNFTHFSLGTPILVLAVDEIRISDDEEVHPSNVVLEAPPWNRHWNMRQRIEVLIGEEKYVSFVLGGKERVDLENVKVDWYLKIGEK